MVQAVFVANAVIVVLEQLVIVRFERYHYNMADALLVIGDVPLVVVVGLAMVAVSLAVHRRGLDLTDRVVAG